MSKLMYTGTPSLEEWAGIWHATGGDDSPPDIDEFNEIWRSLVGLLKQKYQMGCGIDYADFSAPSFIMNDRTLCLMIDNPMILTRPLLELLQSWLREQWPEWRLRIPTIVSDMDTILVYPRVIRISAEFEIRGNADIDKLRNRILEINPPGSGIKFF